jgi:catechol 2,3-dioxygenase-like lactoylglutathione lyase family enzyme
VDELLTSPGGTHAPDRDQAGQGRLNLARIGSQYLGAAQSGVMVRRGFTGRLHLGLEIDPADFERAVDHLRRQGIEVTIRPQQPGYMDTPESVGAYFLDPDANLIEL